MPARFLKRIEKPKKRIVSNRSGSSAPITVGDAQAFHKADLDKLTTLFAEAPPALPLIIITLHAPKRNAPPLHSGRHAV